MSVFCEVLAQADSAPIVLFYWLSQLASYDAEKQLLVATNPDNSNDGDGTGSGPIFNGSN